MDSETFAEQNNNEMNNNEGERPNMRSSVQASVVKRLGPEDRKHSNSDLQSRLKTRKLLGVGELVGNTGDIYRSKISQILGINESLYVKLPFGTVLWHSFNAVYFYGMGSLCLIAPRLAATFELPSVESSDVTALRLYGASLISFAVLFRGLLVAREGRSEISAVMLSCAVLFSLQFCVNLLFGGLKSTNIILLAFRLIGTVGNLCYHSLIDTQGGLFRFIYRQWSENIACAIQSPVKIDEKDKSA